MSATQEVVFRDRGENAVRVPGGARHGEYCEIVNQLKLFDHLPKLVRIQRREHLRRTAAAGF